MPPLVDDLDAIAQVTGESTDLVGQADRPGELEGQAGRVGIERVSPIDGEAQELGRCIRRIGDHVERERAAGLGLIDRAGGRRGRIVADGGAGDVPLARDTDVVDPRIEASEQVGVVRGVASAQFVGGDQVALGVEEGQG